jgi:DNA polymerase III gamma/tau subunit
LIYQVSQGDLHMLEVTENEVASLKEQSAVAGPDVLMRVMEVLADAEGRLRDAASKKIFVEVTLLKAIQSRNASSIDAVLNQLQQLRSDANGGASVAGPAAAAAIPAPRGTVPRAVEPVRTAVTAPQPSQSLAAAGQAAPPAASSIADVDLPELWRQVLEAVGRASPFTKTYLTEAHPVSFANNVFTIGFDPEFADNMDLVNNQKNHALLQTKLSELGHPNTQIKFIKAEAPPGWGVAEPAVSAQAPPPAPVPPPAQKPAPAAAAPQAAVPQPKRDKAVPTTSVEEFKNDPLIQKALEIFKGQIVEVRA